MQKELIQDGMGNYMKITGVEMGVVPERIFACQDVIGFLPSEVRRVNGEKEYWYDTSGRISLASYLRESALTVENGKKILLQFFSLLDTVQEYLLDTNGVVCHEDYLYIQPGTLQLCGIYQPSIPHHGMKALTGLIETFIDEVGSGNEEVAFFLYELHRQSQISGMTLHQFRLILEETSAQTPNEAKQTEVLPERKRSRETSRAVKRPLETKKKEIPLLPCLMLGMGGMIVIILWRMGMFCRPISGETDWVMGVGASAFFLGVAAYGAWRTWPKESCVDCVDVNRRSSLCLIPCQGRDPMIFVNHFPFSLGQEKERVDGYIPSPGISRIHAQIIQEGDDMLLLDEESSNGTFFNEERMIPWQRKKLHDGDRIRLARTEYVVEIT